MLRASWTAALVMACSQDNPPPPPGHVHFETACAPTAAIAFPDAAVGQTAMMVIDVVNDGDVDITLPASATYPLVRLTGANSGQFTLANDDWRDEGPGELQYHCRRATILPVGGWCQVTVLFNPTTIGLKQANLAFMRAGSLPLSGSGIDPSAAFHADWVNPAWGLLFAGYGEPQRLAGPGGLLPAGGVLQLVNDSTATVSTALAVDAPFAYSSGNCPAILTPGGACSAGIGLASATAQFTSCLTGHLSGSGLDIPVTYTPAMPFPTGLGLENFGDGYGQVVSSDGTVDCAMVPNYNGELRCGTTYWQQPPTSLDLSATAADGSWFVGWGVDATPCETASACTVMVPAQSRLMSTGTLVGVWFALNSDKRIQINIVGTGIVHASLYCTSSCTLAATTGQMFPIEESTTGTFIGWSGDCTGTSSTCSLGTIENDRTVTATFSP